jgi:multimeric flavodoxin WrbA
MKIVVLNGSPKGEVSVTMQYVAFMAKSFPEHEFQIQHIAQTIRAIEGDQAAFDRITGAIAEVDGVLWAFPLYYCLVHSSYKRFIELISEKQAQEVFGGKPAAILTTSINFYDHTAHNYIHGICDDLGMKVYGSFSAAMEDLLADAGQRQLQLFGQGFLDAIKRDAPSLREYPPLVWEKHEYFPGDDGYTADTQKLNVIIVTDAAKDDSNLRGMTDRLKAFYGGRAEVFNLRDIDIKGGCLGCIQCGYDNTCAYSGKDGFIDFFNKVKSADIIVFAGTIQDRYLSSLWKTFFDRSFFNTHIPNFSGKQLAYLISGPFSQLPNLRQILEGYTEMQQANLVGIVTDEPAESMVIDRLLKELAFRSVDCAQTGYMKPPTYLSVGGRKIFRDEVWGRMRFPFAADHRYYKEAGFYDFPQKEYKARAHSLLLSLLVRIPAVRKKINSQMKDHMVASFKKLLAKP